MELHVAEKSFHSDVKIHVVFMKVKIMFFNENWLKNIKFAYSTNMLYYGYRITDRISHQGSF